MKKFLLITVSFLLGAVVAAVGVFMYLQTQIESPDASGKKITVENSEAAKLVPETGIELKTLPLSEGQIKAIQAVGINAEEFVITKEMAACAEGKLGSARTKEILGGDPPTLIEAAAIQSCI